MNFFEFLNSCFLNKCLNGVVCIEGKNIFYCVCLEYIFGRFCEKKIIFIIGMNV